MKHLILTLFMFAMGLSLSAHAVQGTEVNTSEVQATQQTIYYVVVGSFSNRAEASRFAWNAPGDSEWGNVYQATANGKTVYRVCTACYYSKANAQKEVNRVAADARQWGLRITPWVWANSGMAKCVERVTGASGEPYPVRPI